MVYQVTDLIPKVDKLLDNSTVMILMDDLAVVALITSDLHNATAKATIQSKLIDLQQYLETLL